MSAFHQVSVRAEWQDWTFGAHQAAARAAAAEELIALRRQYTELSEPDLKRLAESWRPDDKSGPYFTFAAADPDPDADSGPGAGPEPSTDIDPGAGPNPSTGSSPDIVPGSTHVLVDATFVKALFHELDDQAPAALAALLDRWSEQRDHATYAGLRPTPAQPPRVAILLPRDDSQWPPDSWRSLLALDLDAPHFDGALLRWNSDSALWSEA